MSETPLTLGMSLPRTQRDMLLYCETVCVDLHGRLADEKCNLEDNLALPELARAGLLDYGLVSCAPGGFRRNQTRWVKLTDLGFEVAWVLRKQRAEQGWAERLWRGEGEEATHE